MVNVYFTRQGCGHLMKDPPILQSRSKKTQDLAHQITANSGKYLGQLDLYFLITEVIGYKEAGESLSVEEMVHG